MISDPKQLNLLIVMTIHNEEEFIIFQLILDNWEKLVDHKNIRILFSTSIGKVPETKITHKTIFYKDGADDNFRKLVSIEWMFLAAHIEENEDCDLWFWWESDVVPIQKDCFSFFLSKWTEKTKVMGYRVHDYRHGMNGRFNGVAFYSKSLYSLVQPRSVNNKGNFDHLLQFSGDGVDSIELNIWYLLTHHDGNYLIPKNIKLVHGRRGYDYIKELIDNPNDLCNCPLIVFNVFRSAIVKLSYINIRFPFISMCRKFMKSLFTR